MRRRESGYAILIALLLAALVLIALSAVVPRLLTQGQRQQEEELIFRGEQYRRAIGRFYKKFGRYPNSIDELLYTNERAFLRRKYSDPMTPDGEWRLIRVGPNGEFLGSVTGRPGSGKEDGEEETQAAPPSGLSGVDTSRLPLAGVASRSQARSIKVFQGYDHYYQWEFIYDPAREAAGAPQAPAASPSQPSPPTTP